MAGFRQRRRCFGASRFSGDTEVLVADVFGSEASGFQCDIGGFDGKSKSAERMCLFACLIPCPLLSNVGGRRSLR